jgi:hypothetical protein
VDPLDPANPEAGFAVALPGGSEQWIYNIDGAIPNAGGLSFPQSAAGSIGVVRYGISSLLRSVIQGQGSLVDQNGARTLLDLGSQQGVVLEVALPNTTAVLSGTAIPDGVRFYGPGIGSVVFSRDGAQTPLTFTSNGSMVTVGPPPPPTIVNGDFSSGMTGWIIWDSRVVHATGFNAAQLNPGAGNARLVQDIGQVSLNRTYEISFQVRTDGISLNGGFFQVLALDPTHGDTNRLIGPGGFVPSSVTWTTYTFRAYTDNGAALRIYIGNWNGFLGNPVFITNVTMTDVTGT